MHIDTMQAILLGATATVGCLLNGYVGYDEASIRWYNAPNNWRLEMAGAVICGMLGALLGTAISLLACHFCPGKFMASVVAFFLVFPASFLAWIIVYSPSFIAAFLKRPAMKK